MKINRDIKETEVALKLFNSLSIYQDIERLIDVGETESLYLECKSLLEPKLNKEDRINLAKMLSGFSNTEGGVLIYGLSTTKHTGSELDIISNLEPIGNCHRLAKEIENIIPTLTAYPLTKCKVKSIPDSPSSKRGVILVFIPKSEENPIQSISDGLFYFRNGDKFGFLPYAMIKRLFATSSSPDLIPIFDSRLVKVEADGSWKFPMTLKNDSSALARDTSITVEIMNKFDTEFINSDLRDISDVNPDIKLFHNEVSKIFKGLNHIFGNFHVKMKMKNKRPRRTLKIRIKIFSDKMRAKEYLFSIHLAKKGFTVTEDKSSFLY